MSADSGVAPAEAGFLASSRGVSLVGSTLESPLGLAGRSRGQFQLLWLPLAVQSACPLCGTAGGGERCWGEVCV